MSKLPNMIAIERAENGGFVVQEASHGGTLRNTLAAFSGPVDLITWLSRNLMPDVARVMTPPVGAPEQPVASPAIGRLENAYVAPPVDALNQRMVETLDKLPRIRPVPPPEGPGK